MASILAGLERRPTDVNAALHALTTVSERLRRRGDGRACFPDIYGIVTERVAEKIAEGRGFFREAGFISRLAGRFCERYLETLAWSLDEQSQDCTAWRLAYDYTARRVTTPLQDVVLGLSAHINFDLAQGIHATIAEHGHARDRAMLDRYRHDHDAVNLLLAASMRPSFEHLVVRYGCRTSSLVAWSGGPSFGVILRALAVWRAWVWTEVEALCAAGGAEARRAVIRRMESRSGWIGRAMVAPSAAWLLGRRVLPRRADAAIERLLRRPGLVAGDCRTGVDQGSHGDRAWRDRRELRTHSPRGPR